MQLTVKDAEIAEKRDRLISEQRQLLFKRFWSNKLIVIGSSALIIVVLFAFLGPFFSTHTPYEMTVSNRLKPPSLEHLFGTDNFGRDIFSRTVYGAQTSLLVGFTVTILTSFFGLIIGLYASFYRTLDHIFMRMCDGFMAFPGILLAIALMSALGPRAENVILALTIVFTPYIARVVRSAALSVKEETYIEAIKAQGANNFRIMWLHVLPNTLSPLVVQASFIFADAIIVEAGLSFLGAGIPAPDPSWGNILSDGKFVITIAWWMTIFPGVLLILSVLGLNLLGDGLRDFIDPHSNKAVK